MVSFQTYGTFTSHLDHRRARYKVSIVLHGEIQSQEQSVVEILI
jgi:hypothetical protein